MSEQTNAPESVTEEKVVRMSRETKSGLTALAVLACSLASVFLFAFSDSPIAAAAVVVFAVVFAAVVAAAVFTAVFVAVVAVVAAGNFYACGASFLFVLAAGLIIIASWDKEKKDARPVPTTILFLVFLLPFVFLVPLSKYHNLNLLEKDKGIAEKMEARAVSGETVLVLPPEIVGEHRYLSKVLWMGYGGEQQNWRQNFKQSWKKTALRCQRGKRIWYEAPQAEGSSATVVGLVFCHPWQDYQTSLTLSQ